MNSSPIRLLVVILFVVIVPQWVMAQEEVEDYHIYKFYKEQEQDVLEWFACDVDSVANAQDYDSRTYLPGWEYQLRSLGYARRGESRYDSKYAFENVNISYTASRLLSRLGVRGDYLSAGALLGSTVGCTQHSFHDSSLHSRGHVVGANLSGRNYLVALNHSAAYRLSNSGVELDDDWLLSEYVRINMGRDIYVDGLFANGAEAALSLSRKWRNNSFIISAMLPWSRRSVRQATTQEAVMLTANRGYNPAWGMQGSKMRSSRINTSFTPTLLGSWQRRLGMWTTMQLTLVSEFGIAGRSALAWCDAMTPMPDNYRYMPSYYSDDDGRELADAWRYNDLRYTQIAWDELYRTNSLQPDGNAAYFVESRRTHSQNHALGLDFTTLFRGVELEYGLRLKYDSDRCFKSVDDLLGARQLLDIDYFVRDDATYGTKYRNNLLANDNIVFEGEHFGYDYRLSELSATVYGIARWRVWDVDFELAADISTSALRRRGYFEKELFPGYRSYGHSRGVSLFPATLSLQCDYTLGSHTLNAMLLVSSDLPERESLFLQPQYNNRLVDNPQLRRTTAAQVGYRLMLPRLSLSASLYATYHDHESDVLHYYDDLAEEYVDAVVSGIARLNLGVELDARLQWSQYFSSQAAVNIGYHRYAQDATVATYADDDNDLVAVSRSAIRGYNCSMPELATYVDLAFRRSGWQAVVSFSYVGLRYATPSFVRRTERIYSYASTSEEQAALLAQESLGGAVSLNISVARSFRFSGGRWLSVRLAADNLLGYENIYSGYEQHRIRRVVISQREHVRPFANKVVFGYGRTCRINISFGF